MGVLPVRGGSGTNDPGRVTFSEVPLIFVIMQAYDIDPERIKSPSWIGDFYGPKYTIVATMPTETTQEQISPHVAKPFGGALRSEGTSRSAIASRLRVIDSARWSKAFGVDAGADI